MKINLKNPKLEDDVVKIGFDFESLKRDFTLKNAIAEFSLKSGFIKLIDEEKFEKHEKHFIKAKTREYVREYIKEYFKK